VLGIQHADIAIKKMLNGINYIKQQQKQNITKHCTRPEEATLFFFW